jgi:anti-sigma B factor antagonist
MPAFRYEVSDHDGTVVVSLEGELDMSATFELEPALERLAAHEDTRTLVLDMGGVTFMDSSALGLVLSTEERSQAEDVRLVVAAPSRAVQRVLEVTGAGETLSIDPDGPRKTP